MRSPVSPLVLLALTFLLALTACGEADPIPEPLDGATADAGTADGAPPDPADAPATVRFAVQAGGEPVSCTAPIQLGAPAREAALNDLRLFVSALEVRGADGRWAPLAVEAEAPWQGEGVALLDFEDGTGSCAGGTAATRDHLAVRGPAGPWSALRFELGLPFAQNHQDPTRAAPPLDQASMFWVWQSGYKFVRLDLTLADGGAWKLHLGSTGCEAAVPVAAPSEPCARPNRAVITLEGFDPTTDQVVLDLAALVAGLDLAQNTPDTPPGCMSVATEAADCAAPFAALGLDFNHGGRCAGAPCAHPAVYSEALR